MTPERGSCEFVLSGKGTTEGSIGRSLYAGTLLEGRRQLGRRRLQKQAWEKRDSRREALRVSSLRGTRRPGRKPCEVVLCKRGRKKSAEAGRGGKKLQRIASGESRRDFVSLSLDTLCHRVIVTLAL